MRMRTVWTASAVFAAVFGLAAHFDYRVSAQPTPPGPVAGEWGEPSQRGGAGVGQRGGHWSGRQPGACGPAAAAPRPGGLAALGADGFGGRLAPGGRCPEYARL